MKAIRFAIISLIVLFLMVTCIGMLFSSNVTVVRQTDIRTDKDTLYNYLSDIRHWNAWMLDSTEEIAYFTPYSNKRGASAQIGHSRVTIKNLTDSSMDTEWQGTRGNAQTSGFRWFPSKTIPNAITVQWYFTQKLGWYPWQRIGASLNEKILGPSMEKDLEKLKTALDK